MTAIVGPLSTQHISQLLRDVIPLVQYPSKLLHLLLFNQSQTLANTTWVLLQHQTSQKLLGAACIDSRDYVHLFCAPDDDVIKV